MSNTFTSDTLALCACGCGQRVKSTLSKYRRGHNNKRGRTEEERFWSYVKKEKDGCWLFIADSECSGYGRFSLSDGLGRILAHRYSWELHFGPIPDGMLVCHRCDVLHGDSQLYRRCVNPDHLFLGSHRDNYDDMINKNRHPGRSGEMNGRAKLNWDKVRIIRRLRKKGFSAEILAKMYKVSEPLIYMIARGDIWQE